ncbi:alpha/beta fold hydrolase [Gluconobacter morbifer]|uniref:Biotin synthesis protein BioH n=1 Tax=Gluconobacter morbifer G707 TaxID=1088869 RepID=G6XJC5_9PROT|nr:alpha/beta hydrolase [Gluconobacter morbifer]EHH68241.1 biotin synthesis protein BioH [Gluconobacter morbifer G707]
MIMDVYCVHGWGFDASFWELMLDHLHDMTAHVADCGYYGAEYWPALPERPYIAVGHSAGALHLLRRPLPRCAGLVFFNGFPRFVAGEDFPQGTPARFLERMRSRLGQAPEAVLADFRKRCGVDSPLPGVPCVERLERGLTALLEEDHRMEAGRWGDRLHWMTGRDDPFDAARAGFSSSGQSVEGGHLLPLTQPEACARFLRSSLSEAQ